MPPELPDEELQEVYDRLVAENPDDAADQAPLTVEADTEVPTPAMVRRGWYRI